MESKTGRDKQSDPVSVIEFDNYVASERKKPNYAPFVTRIPFLLFICCIVLACVGALQFAVKRSIPITEQTSPNSKSKRHELSPVTPTPVAWHVYAAPSALHAQGRRQEESESTPMATPAPTSLPTTSVEELLPGDRTTSSHSSPTIGYAPTTGFVELEGDPTTTRPPTNSDSSTDPYLSRSSSGYVEIDSNTVTSGYPAPTKYIEITETNVDKHGKTITAIATYRPSDVTYSTFVSTFTGQDGKVSSTISSAVVYSTFTSSFTGSDGKVSTTIGVRPAQKFDGVIPSLLDGPEVQIPLARFRINHYIYATYGPAFIAVILKILWACVYSGNKMMEPFYQLGRKSGASAKESLMADYLSSGISWWSLKVMFRGHWTMLLTVCVSLFIGLLPSFATEAMGVRTTATCLFSDGSTRRCRPIWVLNLNMVRVTQTLLSLIAFCILIIVSIKLRRRSGLTANPSSIASMASLLQHPDIVREIRSIDRNASNEEVASILAQNRYIIGTYRDAHGQERTGLMRASVNFHSTPATSARYTVEYTAVMNPADTNKRPLRRDTVDQLIDGLLVLFIIGILGVTLAFWKDGSDSGFNTFFSADRFGPRFILTSAASMIAMAWLDLEREVRILSPYRKLARRNADPKQTVLATVDGYPHMSLFSSLRRKNFFHFLVALAAVFSDVLIIAVGSVPFNSAQIWRSFVVGTWVTVAILVFMIPVVIGLFIWRRANRKLAIPYQPNETLLRTWMGIANEGNQIRAMFDGWDGASKTDRDKYCMEQEGTYWAGWIREVDGMERWCVDKEMSTTLVDYQPYRPN